MIDTEHLKTLVVAMQKSQEKDWLASYEMIGDVSHGYLLICSLSGLSGWQSDAGSRVNSMIMPNIVRLPSWSWTPN